MEPRIVERDDILLIGLEYFGTLQGEGWNEENPIGHLWNRWQKFKEEYGHLIEEKIINPEVGYEVASWNDEEYEHTGQFYIFVGVEIKDIDEVFPLQLVMRRLPGGVCAEFTINSEETQKWEDMFYHKWLPESGYRCAKYDGYSYQMKSYQNGFFKSKEKGKLSVSEINVIVPVDRMI